MINTCIRCSSIFVGIFSLIQALIWAAGSIWGIGIHDCTASYPLEHTVDENTNQLSVAYLFYVSYLRGECANPGLNYAAPTSIESYRIMLAYSIISSIWVPASVALLAGTCLGVRGAKAMWIYFPYLIVTTACCTIDIYATVKYGIDIGNSLTTTDYLATLNFPNELVKQALGFGRMLHMDGLTFIPAIIMTLIASRVVILWIINLFFIIFGLQGTCAFYKKLPPKVPQPFHEFEREMQQKEFKKEEQSHQFRRPEAVPNHIPNLHPVPTQDTVDHGRGIINNGFVLGEPLRLNPVEVEVTQERVNPIRYAEVEDIEMEPSPQEIRRTQPAMVHFIEPEHEEEDARVKKLNNKLERLEQKGLIIPYPKIFKKELNVKPEALDESRGGSLEPHSIVGVNERENFIEEKAAEEATEEAINATPATSIPPQDTNKGEQGLPRRVYDVNGNPTEERLTPKVARIQRILEAHSKSTQQAGLNGFSLKPFSYTQPNMAQVDTVPKKNDTIRGIDKPPIPVPDYSVRVTKKPSFRTPLPNNN